MAKATPVTGDEKPEEVSGPTELFPEPAPVAVAAAALPKVPLKELQALASSLAEDGKVVTIHGNAVRVDN